MPATNVRDHPPIDGLRSERPAPSRHAGSRRDGFVELADLWTPAVTAAISEEAHHLFAIAEKPVSGPRTPVAEYRMTGRATPVATGPILHDIHQQLASHVRALSGRMLVPSFANYGYFPDEDGVILHVDTDATEIVVLTTALGAIGALHVHPELSGMAPEALGQLRATPVGTDTAARCSPIRRTARPSYEVLASRIIDRRARSRP